MTSLLVAGCSFSDYANVKVVYGEILANFLNANEYIHEAAGCGSNYRIWRKVVSSILDKKIKKNDYIIVQYTNAERQEIWSPFNNDYSRNENGFSFGDPFSNGSILKFKSNSYSWQKHSIEKKFFNMYEKFINIEFELEKFRVNHNMFQTFLSYNGFRNVYFLNSIYAPDYELIDEYKKKLYQRFLSFRAPLT